MADHAATAMFAHRCERMNRAFEAVEGVRASVHHHLERLVVIVPADFTFGHLTPRWTIERVNRGCLAQFRECKKRIPARFLSPAGQRAFSGGLAVPRRGEVPIVVPQGTLIFAGSATRQTW